MKRRTFLFGFVGCLAAASAIIAAASSVEAAPVPETLLEAASPSALTEANLETVKTNWTRAVHRVARRTARRVTRRH
jgi:hypothetical protein